MHVRYLFPTKLVMLVLASHIIYMHFFLCEIILISWLYNIISSQFHFVASLKAICILFIWSLKEQIRKTCSSIINKEASCWNYLYILNKRPLIDVGAFMSFKNLNSLTTYWNISKCWWQLHTCKLNLEAYVTWKCLEP